MWPNVQSRLALSRRRRGQSAHHPRDAVAAGSGLNERIRPSSFVLRPFRPAYTLLEILLVLAIIVVAAAAVAPSFRRMARNSNLKAAAGEVRADLTRAHVLAMKSGRVQVFQYELGGRKFKIEPWIGDDEALEGKGTEVATPATTNPDGTPKGERNLPEGIKFALGDASFESRGERIEQQLETSGGTEWSRPILFFPDGSSADAFLVVANEVEAAIRLDLRGMTGAVKVSDITSLQELESGELPTN
jgi:type II secretory pathway pseudopilin PulG